MQFPNLARAIALTFFLMPRIVWPKPHFLRGRLRSSCRPRREAPLMAPRAMSQANSRRSRSNLLSSTIVRAQGARLPRRSPPKLRPTATRFCLERIPRTQRMCRCSRTLPYDPVKDFAPITFAESAPAFLLVTPESPMKSVDDLRRFALAKRSDINVGVFNVSGVVAAALLKAKGGFDFVQIPYKAPAPAVTDLLGGRLDALISDVVNAISLLQGQKVRTPGRHVAHALPAVSGRTDDGRSWDS